MNQHQQYESDDINLLEYWQVIKRRQKMIGMIIGVITFATVILSLIFPKSYRATAVIMPIGKGGGGGGGLSTAIGQFGGLSSIVGIGGGQTAIQQFMALLKTQTLAEDVIKETGLIKELHIEGKNMLENMEIATRKLDSHIAIVEDRRMGIIKISSEFEDPKLATRVANTYVKGLQMFINRNSFTVAKRNRIFIEQRLDQNKQDLLEAGKQLNEFYKNEKVSSVDSKVDVSVETAGRSGAIDDKDQSFNSVPMGELENLQKRKTEIDQKISEFVVVKDVPQQVYLQYLTLRRKLLEEINTLLTQQYEVAKIEEAKDELAFQIIDPAREPTSRFKPKRKQMVLVGFSISVFTGIFAAFFMNYLNKMKKTGMS